MTIGSSQTLATWDLKIKKLMAVVEAHSKLTVGNVNKTSILCFFCAYIKKVSSFRK